MNQEYAKTRELLNKFLEKNIEQTLESDSFFNEIRTELPDFTPNFLFYTRVERSYQNLYVANPQFLLGGLVGLPSWFNGLRTLLHGLADIDDALSDIDESKSLSLDCFSLHFFKEAWDIIKEDVYTAILHFFNDGAMYSPINITSITLVPKISNASKLKNFRPISCCYSGFIPGRQICDNILLATDLIQGYKVDMANAYDFVEWSFLKCVMQQMIFPSPFINWVMSCMFEEEERRYHFHPKCKCSEVMELLFADDLLVFLKANLPSMHALNLVLYDFSMVFGLSINKRKSALYVAGVDDAMSFRLVQASQVPKGVLPYRYLRVPLSAKRLGIQDCLVLVEKITSRINH
ncbi:uncharacterized protein LOC130824998 [Amaranthus tricolor]|uniref:uncharacterized protein LOC130824998 n=1 Tax=Amaranthus tricolor TaxID=29722 RepID=UPI00258A9C9B|nr:uncharacterized protein LOC130824998 [Amaranthus tricolor]